jgi:Protein ENHANCED DISEASE RESISTANCE 2, C-terminal
LYSYLETDVEIGSSSVAASVTRLSIGYAKTLVVELAWAIQGETEEELPEVIIGISLSQAWYTLKYTVMLHTEYVNSKCALLQQCVLSNRAHMLKR